MSFLRKLGHIVMALLRALDIVLCVIWLSPLYLVGLADRPCGNETISAYVGGGMLNGKRWAIRAGRVIDWLAKALANDTNHCIRAALHYRKLYI